MALTALRPSPPSARAAPSWRRFSHRPAIDGLRAIAALLVVLFHAKMPGFENGYVGVDVFFVLSGYLITSLLLRERLGSGRIHLRAFYARRVRRLLPAALSVLLVTAFVYAVTAPSFDILENRVGFLFAALYASNWYFLGQSNNYFAQDSSPSPVLHYWSLSVEEQFYLVWPLVLIALLSVRAIRGRLGPWVLGGVTLAATVTSGLIASQHQMLAYFGTLGRAYQLLLGATLATVVLWWNRRTADNGPVAHEAGARLVGRLLVAVGVALLVVAGTNLGSDNPWVTGLVGCVATVAVLGGVELGPSGSVQAALSARVPRVLGRWSYSIYLWHWPVIVLALTAGVLPGQWWLRVPSVLAVTISLAGVTWWLIEGRTTRITLRTLPRQRAVVVGGVMLTVLAAVVSQRVLHVSTTAQALYQEVNSSSDVASAAGTQGGSAPVVRRIGPPGPTMLIVGDSHAGLWRLGAQDYGTHHGFGVAMVTTAACPWIDVNEDWGTMDDPHCAANLRQRSVEAVRKYRPDVLILETRSLHLHPLRTPQGDVNPGDPGWAELVRAGAASYLAQVAPYAKQIVLIEPLPETKTPMAKCLADPHGPGACDQPEVVRPGMPEMVMIYHALDASSAQITSVSVDALICPGGMCPAQVGGIPTHLDTSHLTTEYATRLVPALFALLRTKGIAF